MPAAYPMGIATLLKFSETEKAYGCIKPDDSVKYFEADSWSGERKQFQIWLPKSMLRSVEESFDQLSAMDEITFRAPTWLLDENNIPYQDD